jgi:beta-lactamase class A
VSRKAAVEERLRAAFAGAGGRGWLHAVDVDAPGAEVGLEADAPVVLASVFKLPLLVELQRQAAAGALDLTEQVTVPAGARTPGLAGLAAMRDPATLSLRDLAYLMIAVSDVAAADVLYDRVGEEAVNATLRALGLRSTRLLGCSRDLVAALAEDAGARDPAELPGRLADPAVRARLRVLDPARTGRGTPRELTRLLALTWRDEAGPPAACAEVRRLLGLQVWPHRLAAGFPSDAVAVAGKTGTLPGLRNEVGVVEYPDGGRYAVAVFTRTDNPAPTLPQADAVIGVVARMAVEALRADRPVWQS